MRNLKAIYSSSARKIDAVLAELRIYELMDLWIDAGTLVWTIDDTHFFWLDEYEYKILVI